MTTSDALVEYVTQLDRPEVAFAVVELLRRADPDGVLERDAWTAAVAAAAGRASDGSPDVAAAPAEGSSDAGPGEEKADRLLARLEADGVAAREPRGPDWRTVRVPDDLWATVRSRRDAVVEAVEGAVTAPEGLGASGTSPSALASAAPATGGSRLWAEGLTKAFRNRTVVDDVDISVEQGEIVGLLGPNGAGKTTTFYMIVGLIQPNEGRVFLDGDEITKVPMYQRARRGIGYLAQEPSIFRRLTVEQNVRAILETLDIPKEERKARLEELLDELSIAHLRDSVAYSLSGGERRRLEITRALVQRPKFMLLDEPFAGIDPIATSDIQQIVRELKNRRIGVIISDHNVEQTLDIVDRAYIMYEGRIRVGGTVSELVWNDEVAEIYLGPTLTERMRQRYASPPARV